jgi:hypothetical protein
LVLDPAEEGQIPPRKGRATIRKNGTAMTIAMAIIRASAAASTIRFRCCVNIFDPSSCTAFLPFFRFPYLWI